MYICVLLLAATIGIGRAQAADPPAAPQWTIAEIDKGYVVFEHNTLERMPSDYVPARKKITDKLSCALARGEYNSVQFAVHAVADGLENIHVTVTSDLEVTTYRRRAEYTVPAAPQATEADLDKRVASPSEWMYLERGNAVDSLPAGVSVNFWLTIRAGADTSPGTHAGKIRVEVQGKPATELDLAIDVRPFQLAPARIPFGMYYSRGHYSPNRGPDASHEFVYRDMAAHSQNSVSFSASRDFRVDFKQVPLPDDHPMVKVINTARDAGLVSPRFPCMIISSLLYNESREVHANIRLTEAQLKAAIAWLAKQRREHDWPEIISYTWDEPPVPAPGIRESYAPLRPLPIRAGTAMSAKAAYAYGDIHDVWIVHDGHITPEMQAEAARRGAQVWTYTYRLWRQSYNPLIQRFYAGLYTWALRLSGNYVWEYYYGYNWVDPVTQETMPTTGWEARREGVDDYRYLQMVEDAVKASPDDPAAIEASVWLEKLRSRIVSNFNQDRDGYWDSAGFPVAVSRVEPHTVEAGKPFATDEYDEIRSAAAGHIMKLGPASPPMKQPAPVSYVKDEAAAFRGKSVEQCIEGLRSPDAATRRAAAWALSELGPQAASAVPELTIALDDPEVRIPALLALEAIGPKASPAAPKVASLLSHPDDFIRQGATFTLKGLSTVHKELLVETPELWSFRKDPEKAGESEKWFLPAVRKDTPPWTRISTHEFWEQGYVGHGWYALDIVIPKTDGRRVWLHFGSVDENYTLWINGQYVDDNMDAGLGLWNVPVEAEITGKFEQGESNHIVVRVSNKAAAGGIWKPVTLLVSK